MKAILIPIHPEWISKIFNGEKSIEIRKSKALYKATMELIQKQGFARFFIYCTKNGYGLIKLKQVGIKPFYPKEYDLEYGQTLPNLNGKVVGQFDCKNTEEIKFHFGYYDMGEWTESYILEHSCLTAEELDNYFQASKTYDEKKVSKTCGYAYHIEDLVIFDKPKVLSEFGKYGFDFIGYAEEKSKVGRCFGKDNYLLNKHIKFIPLTKAPQNFCYVESEE